jgi:hypothetical protein
VEVQQGGDAERRQDGGVEARRDEDGGVEARRAEDDGVEHSGRRAVGVWG